jgi:NADPH2:quinone reductase
MRAVVCKEYGPPERLVVEEVAPLIAGPGQAVVAVKAAGVNFPDSLIIEGKYQFKPAPPFTPGGEIAGVVKQVGEGVTEVKVGDRVVALAPYGGYAEEMLVAPAQLVPMPDGLDFVPAACALTVYGTTQYALADRARLQPGETLLVLGAAGGVGLAAIELGKLLGARVIAAASSPEKLATCRAAGADAVIDYAHEDLKTRLKQLTSGNGADVIYDPVGGPYTEPALRGIAWNGRLLVIGFAAGEIPKIPINLTLLKGCAIVGVFWGSFLMREPAKSRAMHAELLTFIRDGKLKPHIHATYPLERAAEALAEVTARRVQGKVALTTG